jgi:hypothetical protein
MTHSRLSLRALNRAALHRQLLLGRAPMTARDAVRHLAGLQAQAPLAPYVGLWTRLAGFRHEALKDLLTERAVLRAHLMRNTVHLVDAADYVRFRPLYQPLLALLTGGTTPQAPRWRDHDPASLAYAASHLLPLVQVPSRGLWGEPNHRAAFMLAEAWLAGRAPSASPAPAQTAEQLVLRYLAAYGPASVADAQAWSGLTRLREVTDRLGSRLRAFTGPDGTDPLDLPDAPRPEPDVPAPPRFLPEYDNLLLSYADWKISDGVLEIEPFISLGPADRDAVAAEGERLLGFAVPAIAVRDVRFVPVRSG